MSKKPSELMQLVILFEKYFPNGNGKKLNMSEKIKSLHFLYPSLKKLDRAVKKAEKSKHV